MKNLKPLTLLAFTVIIAFVSLFVKNASGDPVNERPEIIRPGSSPDIRSYAESKLVSDNLQRYSEFKQIAAELEYIISNPEVFIKVSGYNVYPGTK